MNKESCKRTTLPCGWERCVLPDFAGIVMGQSPDSVTYNQSGDGLPFFQGKAEFGELYPTIKMYCSQPKKIAKRGATLLSVRAPVGPTNLAQSECCIGRGLAALHPCGGIEPKFLLYLFKCIEPEISRQGTGSTFNAVTKGFIENLEFDLPPLPEQNRIVSKIKELFSELNKGIESLKTAREQLNLYRQAVLKHAFEGRLTAKWREENKNHLESSEQLLDRIKQEREARYERQLYEWKTAVKDWETRGRISKKPAKPQRPNWQYNRRIERGIDGLIVSYETANMLPAGWTECSIGEVTLPVSKIVPKAHPNREIDYIDISSIDNARHVIGSVKQYRLEDAPSRARQIVRTGDVLFATVRPYLRNIASVPDEYDQQIASTGFSVLRPAEGVCPAFLYYKAISRDLVNALSGVQYGVSYPAIRDEQVRDQTLWLPPTDEQHCIVAKIEERFSKVEKALEIIDTQMTKAKLLRQSILKKAFTGRLIAQNPYDEPASVLLHRIRAERDLVAKKNTPKKTKKRTTTT